MNYLTLDFETYYDKAFMLSKMTTQEYVVDKRFAVLMCGLKWNDDETFVLDADQIPSYFAQVDWTTTAVICHNTVFDGLILSHHYGVRPAFLIDTMSMAQASGMQTLTGSSSLAKCVDFIRAGGYALPPKGKEVLNALGKRREHFTPLEWEAYRGYCATDVTLTWELFKILRAYLPDEEMVYQDMMLRCATEPMMQIHRPTVDYELARVQKLKAEALQKACDVLGTTPDALAAELRSNDKFARLLHQLGGVTEAELAAGMQGRFIIPTKVSPTTGKVTWAFGKSDEDFTELAESDDPVLQVVCQARLSAKSSIDETRCELFQRVSDTGFLGIAYKISGAHTHRLGGKDGNYQNLPSGRKAGQSDLLRRSLLAQDGMVCVNYDASQIEVRVNAYISNQFDLLGVFQSGGDPYSFMASDIYGEPAETIYHGAKKLKDPAYDLKRQTGKVAVLGLGFGMGAAKLQTTALTQYGIHLTTEQAKHITKVYRNKMYGITGFWKVCEQVLAVLADGGQMYFGGPDGKLFFADGNRVLFGHRVPGIRLPDGMWLNYPNMRREMKDGKVNFCYDRRGYTGKVMQTWVFSGKMVENCIAEDTEVLTDTGWKPIQCITTGDRIFDGVEFVTHDGILFKSMQPCVSIDGVLMTKDHEVLTTDGWKEAGVYLSERGTSPLQRLNWATLWRVSRSTSLWTQLKWLALGVPMRLWGAVCKDRGRRIQRRKARRNAELRMSSGRVDFQKADAARTITASDVSGVAEHESAMLKPQVSCVQKLRRTWDKGMRTMVDVCQLLRRYVSDVPRRVRLGAHRYQFGLCSGQLHMGDACEQLQQQTKFCSHRGRWRISHGSRVFCEVQSQTINSVVSPETRCEDAGVGNSSASAQPVYDIANCGPRSRFVVRGQCGPFIVHNCVQATAYAVMKWQAIRINAKYPIKMNTHDEWVAIVARAQAEECAKFMTQMMRTAPPWAAGLPLDTEGGWAQSYGGVDDHWDKRPDNPDRLHRFDIYTGAIS